MTLANQVNPNTAGFTRDTRVNHFREPHQLPATLPRAASARRRVVIQPISMMPPSSPSRTPHSTRPGVSVQALAGAGPQGNRCRGERGCRHTREFRFHFILLRCETHAGGAPYGGGAPAR